MGEGLGGAVLEERLQEHAHRAEHAHKHEDPQEEAVNHHGNVLPILAYLYVGEKEGEKNRRLEVVRERASTRANSQQNDQRKGFPEEKERKQERRQDRTEDKTIWQRFVEECVGGDESDGNARVQQNETAQKAERVDKSKGLGEERGERQ